MADEINRELITELFYIIFYIMRNFANTLTRHDCRDRHSKIVLFKIVSPRIVAYQHTEQLTVQILRYFKCHQYNHNRVSL